MVWLTQQQRIFTVIVHIYQCNVAMWCWRRCNRSDAMPSSLDAENISSGWFYSSSPCELNLNNNLLYIFYVLIIFLFCNTSIFQDWKMPLPLWYYKQKIKRRQQIMENMPSILRFRRHITIASTSQEWIKPRFMWDESSAAIQMRLSCVSCLHFPCSLLFCSIVEYGQS